MTAEGLENEVNRVRSVVDRHRRYLDESEQRTRVVLIDPILLQLGWNVTDPERVRLEVRANGNVIDYVLSKGGIHDYAVVEAKSSRAGVDAHRKQATGYAMEIGARYALVTNGLRWEAWELKPGSPRKENVVAEVNIMTGEVSAVARSLQKLSYDGLGA